MKPMGKKAALALVSKGITYGDLRRSIEAGKDRAGLSDAIERAAKRGAHVVELDIDRLKGVLRP
jgi:hypothetical protein